MATLQLQINGWDAGWPTGLVTNVDEPVSGADGQTVATSSNLDTVIFDLDIASVIADIDTVNSIAVTLRASGTIAGGAEPGDPHMDLAILIGGVGQGTENTGSLTTGQANYPLSNAGWDSDWTQAQLNGMQVRVQSRRTGSAGTILNLWDIDTIDVVIDYTPLPPHVALPGVVTLDLAGKVPVSDLSDLFHLAQPAPASLALAGTVPWSTPVITPSTVALAISQELTHANPFTEQLQINGWDSGWSTGLLTNIDEPSSAADGQSISTDSIERVWLDFDDSSAIGVLDSIVSTKYLIRAKVDLISGGSIQVASLIVQPEINGLLKSAITVDITSAEGSFVNFIIDPDTVPDWDWDDAWDAPNDGIANLNGLRLTVIPSGSCTGPNCILRFSLDTIDLVVTYQSAGNFIGRPGTGSLALSTSAPTLLHDSIRAPAIETLVLAGKSLSFVRDDASQISADHLIMTGQAPARISNHITLPDTGTLVVAGISPIRLRDSIRMGDAGTLALTGPAPTVDHEFGALRLPAEIGLTFFTEAPLSTHSPETREGPGIGRALIDGKAVVIVETFNHLRDMTVGELTLTTHLASLDSHTLIPPIASLALSGQAPIASRGVLISVSQEVLLFDGQVPLPATEFLTLTLTGHVPFTSAQTITLPAVTALALGSSAPLALVAAIAPPEVAMNITGHAPSIEIVTVLVTGLPRIISKTVVREIEFIATPTELLIG